jgi:hypothetical protein
MIVWSSRTFCGVRGELIHDEDVARAPLCAVDAVEEDEDDDLPHTIFEASRNGTWVVFVRGLGRVWAELVGFDLLLCWATSWVAAGLRRPARLAPLSLLSSLLYFIFCFLFVV